LRRLAVAAADGGPAPADLENAARALIAELRQRCEPPERMLVHLKEALADAGLAPGYPAADVYRNVITCAIRCYYEELS
jgi:hypothetical protein